MTTSMNALTRSARRNPRHLVHSGVALACTAFLLAGAATPTTADTVATLPIRGASSQGNGVDLSDSIKAYARLMNLPAVFIDPSVPRRSVRYSAMGLDPRSIFDELLRTNGLASAQINGVLHVAKAQVIALRYGGSMQRIFVRRGTPTSLITLLRAFTDDRVAFFPDDEDHLVYAIGPKSDIQTAQQFVDQNGPTGRTEIIPIAHGIAAGVLIKELALQDSSGQVTALDGSNSIAITGDDAFITSTKQAITQLDKDPSVVFYTVSIIEIVPSDESLARGITLGPLVIGNAGIGAAASANSSLGNNGNTSFLGTGSVSLGQYSASLDALFSRGEAKILKRINVSAQNQKEAVADFSSLEPITLHDQLTGVSQVTTVTAGVTLDITPTIGTQSLSSAVKATYSEITGTAANGYPQLSRRSETDVVASRDGESILIAGLYEDDSLKTTGENPPFSYIPIVGGLFHHRNESHYHGEILIIATPNIQTDTVRGPQIEFPAIPKKYLTAPIRPIPVNGATEEPFEYAPATPKPPQIVQPMIHGKAKRPAPSPLPTTAAVTETHNP
jgi:type II secretory pathway component GspD/PulD (secretin)